MATRVSDRLLPTTMVGSYPRPRWFTHQLQGRDVLEAFKSVAKLQSLTAGAEIVRAELEGRTPEVAA